MTLPEAEFIANEFNKFTSVQSAEVVPNVDGDYSAHNTHGRPPSRFFRSRHC